MCRIPKVVIIATPDRALELRRLVSSFDYEVVGSAGPGEPVDVPADIALVDGSGDFEALRAAGFKTACIGGTGSELDCADAAEFKRRVWDLFRG